MEIAIFSSALVDAPADTLFGIVVDVFYESVMRCFRVGFGVSRDPYLSA
jgi:hypothetical protein